MSENFQGIVPQEIITSQIYNIRSLKVMLDRDLARLYGVPTSRLNEQVKRNRPRFPEDFMFQLTKQEMENWISQIAISNSVKKGVRKPPYVFTENGIVMLSSVLHSPRAINVNIQIMRIFTKIREFYMNQKHLFNQLNKHEVKLLKHDKQIAEIFLALQKTQHNSEPEGKPKRKIGFLPPEK